MNKEFIKEIILEFSEAGYTKEDIRDFLMENYADVLTIEPDNSEEYPDIIEGTIDIVRDKLFTEDAKRDTIAPVEIIEEKTVRFKEYLDKKATKKPIANASGKGAPKQPLTPKPKKQKAVNCDDLDAKSRNSDMIKGKFPWGKVSGQLAKSAVSKLKEIEKTSDRLRAMDLIWESEENFGKLLNRTLDYLPQPEKSNITLAEIPSLKQNDEVLDEAQRRKKINIDVPNADGSLKRGAPKHQPDVGKTPSNNKPAVKKQSMLDKLRAHLKK